MGYKIKKNEDGYWYKIYEDKYMQSYIPLKDWIIEKVIYLLIFICAIILGIVINVGY